MVPGQIICNHPNSDLYSLKGSIQIGDHSSQLTSKQLLWRGTMLKNTEWAIGCVIYTGLETKVFCGSTLRVQKLTSIDRNINAMIIWLLMF